MATSEQKQELVDDIRRPVRYYKITLWGYGAEYVAGESSKEEYDYWITNAKQRIAEFGLEDEDDNPFQTYMFEKDETTKWDSVPERLKREYEYYEYNGVESIHGPVENSARITIEEVESLEYDAKVIDTVVDNMDFDQFHEKYVECDHVIGESDDYKHEYIYTSMSSEKGTFFSGVFETQGRLDLSKLTVHSTEIYDGDVIVHDFDYNGEYIENNGAETNSKGTYINLVKT